MGWLRFWMDRRAVAMAGVVAAETAALVFGLTFLDASVRSVRWNLAIRGRNRCTVYGWPRSPRYELGKVREELRDVVRAVERSASMAGSVALGGRSAGRWIVGIDTEAFPDARSSLEASGLELVTGRWLRAEDGTAVARVAVVTDTLCGELGVEPGALMGRLVRLVPARGQGPVPFEVVGVAREATPIRGVLQTPARAFVPLSTLIRRLGYSRPGYPAVVFFARQGHDIEVVGRRVEAAMRKVYGLDGDRHVWTPARFRERIRADQWSFEVLSLWLAVLSVLVLCASTAIATAAIRRAYAPDIRVRRAVGAPWRRVRRELGLVMGLADLAGAIAGGGIGLLLVAEAARRHGPADPLMDPYAFLAPRPVVALGSAALAVAAGMVVAWFQRRRIGPASAATERPRAGTRPEPRGEGSRR